MVGMNPPKWATDAQALMDAAVRMDWSRGPAAVDEISRLIAAFTRDHGNQLLVALREWVDHAKFETGFEPHDGQKPSLEPIDVSTGATLSLDAVPAGMLWAGRFLAAGFGDDREEQRALIDTLCSDLFPEQDFRDAVVATLRLSAEMVRTGLGPQDTTVPEAAWAPEARTLFAAAAREHWHGPDGALELLQRFSTEHGTPAVIGAMKGWCRQARGLIANDVPGEPAYPGWRSTSTDDELAADEVPPAARWAGRFIAAVWNDDEDQARALLGSLRSSAELTECVIETLKTATAFVPDPRG
ncbi:hypothetical protein SAMN04489732_12920 [Amycolatopsis saalfeldensis]|uniref:Uncharacterized protein n=2 Tax=Amycolatopsis saalfeldensis TaxID=394193 RepID=A0A1H8YN26_9PSEU|nr:hypothetical protein SAMN04489732_12920 [Amycolatopsis saalfeldensis]